jgi:hypothetical protein
MAKSKKIQEQIDYGDYPERMDPSLERKISNPESPYAKNPALARREQDVQRLITNRFKQVVDKLRSATSNQTLVTPRNLAMMIKSEAYGKIMPTWQIEQGHLEELKDLALRACLEESEVPEDWFDFDLHLGEQINVQNFRNESEELEDETEEEIKAKALMDGDELTRKELVELEIHKRNIINAIIQGTAKKGHYVFQKPSVRRELNRINPNLYDNYLLIMALNDFNYFTDEASIEYMSETGQGVGGKVELQDNNNDNDEGEGEEGEERPDTTISAWGMLFPILCHEILKGLEEAKGRYGLPEDPVIRQQVMGQTDTLPMEAWSLRIGPPVVERLRFALPDEIFEDENKGLINWFQMELYKLPAAEVIKLTGDAISEDKSRVSKATDRFREIMKKANQLKTEYENFKPEKKDSGEDGLDDLLAGLGISPSK